MLRLEQITALVLAAALAIPSYWFFWTMAGGGGYERREIKDRNQNSLSIPSVSYTHLTLPTTPYV